MAESPPSVWGTEGGGGGGGSISNSSSGKGGGGRGGALVPELSPANGSRGLETTGWVGSPDW